MINNNDLALLSLAHCPALGSKSIKLLENWFPNLIDVLTISEKELLRVGLKQTTITSLCRWRQTFSYRDALNNLEKEGIKFVSWHDNNYPPLLKEIADPPPILFYRGQLPGYSHPADPALAIVGSRNCTAYAEKVMQTILPTELASRLLIISGLALGVDRLAHQQALSSGGQTIAVLGSGLSWRQFYPRTNRLLAEKIINTGGCLLSEFPPHVPPHKTNFPRRNRLISGLAQAVLVIEAMEKSGSLITARAALEQGRDVLAVPGNIFWKNSGGANQLIQAGAKPILKPNDLVETMGLEIELLTKIKQPTLSNLITTLSPAEKLIYSIIDEAYQKGEKTTMEKICSASKLDTSAINSTLTILELRGLIREARGNFLPC